MADAVDVVTDPDVLELYRERVWREVHPSRTQVTAVLVYGSRALLDIATGSTSVRAAQEHLTELGEHAAPLPDEGVPCEW